MSKKPDVPKEYIVTEQHVKSEGGSARVDKSKALRAKIAAAKKLLEDSENMKVHIAEPAASKAERQKKWYRSKRLAMIPQDRKCPECLQIFLNSRQWVISHGKPRCIACHRRASQMGK